MIEEINDKNIDLAAEAFAASWRFSHKGIVEDDELALHDKAFMKGKISGEISGGNKVYTYMAKAESLGIISFNIEGRHISKLYVNPKYIRRGVGRALIGYAIENMKGRGEISVYSLTCNERAIAFYKSLGFKDSGVRYDFPECKGQRLAVFIFDK